MRLGLTSILVLSFAFGLPLAQAQYVEIYRLDNLMKELPDSQFSAACHRSWAFLPKP